MVKYEIVCEDWYSADSLREIALEIENGLLDDMGKANTMEFAGNHYTAQISIIGEQVVENYHNEIRQSIISTLQSKEGDEKETDECPDVVIFEKGLDKCPSVVILDEHGKPAVYDVFGVKTHGKNIYLHLADREEDNTMWVNTENIEYGAEKVLEYLYKILNSN